MRSLPRMGKGDREAVDGETVGLNTLREIRKYPSSQMAFNHFSNNSLYTGSISSLCSQWRLTVSLRHFVPSDTVRLHTQSVAYGATFPNGEGKSRVLDKGLVARDWENQNRKAYILQRAVSARAAPSAYGTSPGGGGKSLAVILAGG